MAKIKYIAAFGIFSIITTEFGVIGILPQLADYYKVSIDVAGLLLSSFALVIALCGPWITLLTSHYDRKKMMVLALFLFFISNVISAIALSFNLQLLARILPAFLHPVYFTSAMTVAIQSVPKENANKAVAIVFSGMSLATVIGVPLIAYITEMFRWQVSFIASGLFNLVACLAVWRFIPYTPVKEKIALLNQLGILKKTTFILSLITACLLIASMFASYGYFADYIDKVFHLNGKQISILLMLFGVSGVAGNWIAGRLLSKNVTGTVIAFACTLIFVFLLLNSIQAYSLNLILLICIWGFVHTACFLIAQVYINSAVSVGKEFANSLGISSGNLGLTIGTLVSGWVITKSGIVFTVWVSIILAVAALLVAVIKAYIESRATIIVRVLPNKSLGRLECHLKSNE